ncbi:divergent PAP2 family protein [Paenibacillus aceris]|uniref:Acid phosphatase family membrane protein YuiD n=1 Tax=Paenibacillus aceris TaxID=869555 RepID=A0ABS4HRS3_9BACL|nr:divergent PAP2 family protein [Paenibacillus aceris]MBP1961312.1 acid phosphatase family membrane protein YuiD [Paenibacillus aceris]NHW37900.1 divergent PAP2 family protein [Paenibacillus aceris]
MNRALVTAMIGIGTAQAMKIPLAYISSKKWDWSQMIQTGGMPSSHSSGVSALATYIAMKRGISAIDFAVTSVFGAVVMYDAMGIRRAAGEIAVEVNDLDEQVERLAKQQPGLYHARRRKALKERLGHLPREVLGGAILGVAIGAFSYMLEKKR